jgi:hypothetical protein
MFVPQCANNFEKKKNVRLMFVCVSVRFDAMRCDLSTLRSKHVFVDKRSIERASSASPIFIRGSFVCAESVIDRSFVDLCVLIIASLDDDDEVCV